ncbi:MULTISPECIES: type I-C CRISPR-associated protein Cas5c [Caproicibacterium]|uniref:pre-crRNA processing endonuclease n=1 Tax=Caproicibacterium argilliputei TaxID=3030016 RepID=A0AA97DC93_9FIRM|nr:type I-C CRISPR-associated protein Cas5c [Caproicibacterium argilliputei]WOC32933.1 type I-C CRISPR-associated protein Cas5c [Caproicibacterium argilliputei]
MSYGLQVEVWGDFALFSRPELKTERMSYEVITPSAARGLIESIYWHPGFRVIIDRIYVLEKFGEPVHQKKNPIQFTNVRRNEVKSRVQAAKVKSMMEGGSVPFLNTSADIQQRAATLLQDVHYVLEAHFELTEKAAPSDNEGKFKDIFRRRLESGRCYSQPYFGCREFPAHFKAWQGGEIPAVPYTKDLGIMLYDLDYSNPRDIQPMFFHAYLRNGVVQVAGEKVLK